MDTPPNWPGPQAGEIFLEPPELEGYLGLWLKVDRVLRQEKTKYQELTVIEAGPLGRLLLLDGSIQVSQFDEPAYHEMLVHVPLLTHPQPKEVLIVGGGDGGSLREVLKHPSVEKAVVCEIDGQVIEASREFLPGLASSFDDPRAEVHLGDGVKYVAASKGEFDVILVDSSDPEGPAQALFSLGFYEDLRQALRPGGIVVSQSESFYLYSPLIEKLFGFLPDIFDLALYYMAMVPTYLSGVIGFSFCSLGPDPLKPPDPGRVAALGQLDYYTPALHQAAFQLPARWLRRLPKSVALRQGLTE
jgi:spermidine synthase